MGKFKSGFVTLIGRPNVGKSTLMNNLIGQKIAITSSKPQTTRNRIQTVYTDVTGQIIFLDTPGIHKAQNKLGEYMDSVAERTLSEVDVVLWLVEPTTFIGKGEQHIAELLSATKTPVILVVNKIDTVEKGELLPVIDKYKDIVNFKACVPVSAVTGENKEDLLKTVFDLLPEGPMYYDEDVITDQAERQITAELIREQALRLLKEEVPHGIAVVIDSMKEVKDTGVRHSHKNIMNIEATIFCERDSHKGIIIGKKGAMLKAIGTKARHQISDLLGMKVNLNLWVKVKKDWRNSDSLMKNFGYKEENH
ncbi:MAG: GTPase Era [Catonella sp.]|uniref:GTPase Era n=1 Tax=Catonella sp. TaxID=2382125 RepID=UPI003F9FE501